MTCYINVRFSVADFDTWKAGFDAHKDSRLAAGGTGTEYVMQNAEDANEVVMLLEWSDLDKAKAFSGSDDLKEAMRKSGVTGPPDIRYLNMTG